MSYHDYSNQQSRGYSDGYGQPNHYSSRSHGGSYTQSAGSGSGYTPMNYSRNPPSEWTNRPEMSSGSSYQSDSYSRNVGDSYHGGFRQRHNNYGPDHRRSDFRNQPYQKHYQPEQERSLSQGSRLYESQRGSQPKKGQEDDREGLFESQREYQPNQVQENYVEDQEDEDEVTEDDNGDEEDNDNGSFEKDNCKVNVFNPDPQVVGMYKYYPPDEEKLRKMFKDIVILLFYKHAKPSKEMNPFVIICESFRRSENYNPLAVSDGYLKEDSYIKFCTLTYNGMMVVRGMGCNRVIKEPRVLAGAEMINKLATTCYTLSMKSSYYTSEALKIMLEKKECPGVYKVISEQEAPTENDVETLIQQFFLDPSHDIELIFSHQQAKAKGTARKIDGLVVRTIGKLAVGINRNRTPQYWKRKILASGKMENERFELIPPLKPGTELLSSDDIKAIIKKPKKQKYSFPANEAGPPNFAKYGPKGVGPNIVEVTTPWEKKGRFKKNWNRQSKRSKNRKKNKK